ncbi:benzoate/H(+) symporter BenE family transporter, partial [Nocardioides kongjuensis]
LLGTLGAALAEGLADPAEREPAAATLVVAASGVTVLGIGAAFWALVAGLLLRGFLRAGRTPTVRPSERTSSTSART